MERQRCITLRKRFKEIAMKFLSFNSGIVIPLSQISQLEYGGVEVINYV